MPFDISYRIPDGLRAEPNDPEQMRRAVAWLEARAERAVEDEERARLLGQAGVCAATLRDVARAARLLDEALGLAAQTERTRQRLVLEIRRADVAALSGDAEGACARLEPLLAVCETSAEVGDLRDFVHQHLGKALLEAGRVDAATRHLEQALALRQRKADADLVASTQAALDAARRMGTGR